MLGIGKWKAQVSTMMFNATAEIEIRDNNGKYEFIYELPKNYSNVKIKIHSVEQVGTNTLRVRGEVSLFPGKIIELKATFNGNSLTGYIHAPIMGGITLKLKNGVKIK